MEPRSNFMTINKVLPKPADLGSIEIFFYSIVFLTMLISIQSEGDAKYTDEHEI